MYGQDALVDLLKTMTLTETAEKTTQSSESPKSLIEAVSALSLAEPIEKMVIESTEKKVTKSPETLTFGKYKGSTLIDLLYMDPEYLRWLAGYSGYRKGNSRTPAASSYTWMTFNGKSDSLTMHHAAKQMIEEEGLCLLCLEPDYDVAGTSWKHWCADCYPNARK
jgi:hypothetical protein